jgi:Mg/Co/Ni transporter MgtE
MAGGRGKINEHPKVNTNGFDKNPQNINKKGVPKKSFAQFNEKLKAEGHEALTKTQLVEAYGLIFNLPEEELKLIALDLKQPFALRLIINEMSNSKTRSKALADFRDYAFGKALAEMKVQTNMQIGKMSEEAKDKIDEILNNEY